MTFQKDSNMGYFRELPTLRYPSFLSDKNSSLDYVDAKNLFRRVKLREDLQSIITLFDKYEIPEGFRPDNVEKNYMVVMVLTML